MFAVFGLARLGSKLVTLIVVLVLFGAVFGTAIFLKNVGSLETQRDILAGANEEQAEVLGEILDEVARINDIQARHAEAISRMDVDLARVDALVARIRGSWMHTPIGELVGEDE